jgi:TRAP-type mannitol/chloroaromatic compound transport system permease small subunit
MDQFDALLAPAADPARPPPTLADRIADAAGAGFAWAFVAAILISVYEVMMRYVFGAPSSWANPTTTTLCQIGFAMGGAYCMARREHIRITFVLDKLPAGRRRFVELFSLGVGAFYLTGLLYAVYLDARNSIWKFDFSGAWSPERTPGPPNWPLPSIGKAFLVIGAALFLAVVVSHIWRLLVRRER